MMHATILWCATTHSCNFHLMQCPTFLSVAIDLPSILHVLSFLTFFVCKEGGVCPFCTLIQFGNISGFFCVGAPLLGAGSESWHL
jgi:hypothetical protein